MSGDAHIVLEERLGCLLHMLTAADELGGRVGRVLLLSYSIRLVPVIMSGETCNLSCGIHSLRS